MRFTGGVGGVGGVGGRGVCSITGVTTSLAISFVATLGLSTGIGILSVSTSFPFISFEISFLSFNEFWESLTKTCSSLHDRGLSIGGSSLFSFAFIILDLSGVIGSEGHSSSCLNSPKNDSTKATVLDDFCRSINGILLFCNKINYINIKLFN